MSGPDAGERGARPNVERVGSDASRAAASRSSDAAVPADWMRRDDEFLLDADREYVLREDDRSWRAWLSPVLFGAGLAALVGDAMAVGAARAMGLATPHPLAAPVVAELGLGGLVLLKATAAVFLLLLPGVTDSLRQTARAGFAGVVAVGLTVAVSTAWVALGVTG